MKELSGAYHCLGDVKKGIRASEHKRDFILRKHVKTCEGLFLNLQITISSLKNTLCFSTLLKCAGQVVICLVINS